jgi:hypothetical protein
VRRCLKKARGHPTVVQLGRSRWLRVCFTRTASLRNTRNTEEHPMWVITRRQHEALAEDGTWSPRSDIDTLRKFDSHDEAKQWIEQEELPDEYVWITGLQYIVTNTFQHREKVRKRERKQLRHCQYVSLGQSERFCRCPEADDAWGIPIFETFDVTHSVMSDGMVIGLFGKTSSDVMPFYCYVGDEYDYWDECYTRRQLNGERHDLRVDG